MSHIKIIQIRYFFKCRISWRKRRRSNQDIGRGGGGEEGGEGKKGMKEYGVVRSCKEQTRVKLGGFLNDM